MLDRRNFLAGLGITPFVKGASSVKKPECFSTGLPTLDSLLCGGLHPGSLTVIWGQDNSGRSVLVEHIARQADEFRNRSVCVQGKNDYLHLRQEDGRSLAFLQLNSQYIEQKFSRIENFAYDKLEAIDEQFVSVLTIKFKYSERHIMWQVYKIADNFINIHNKGNHHVLDLVKTASGAKGTVKFCVSVKGLYEVS